MSSNQSAQDLFLQQVKPYILKKETTTVGTMVQLKPSAYQDADVYREILMMAEQASVKSIASPVGFLIPIFADTDAGERLIYLDESQIEDGGVQPRLEVAPDEELQSLFEQIKANGQKEPIHVYPSPDSVGKYRICDGHRRRIVVFNMLRRPKIKALCKVRTKLEAFEDAYDFNAQRKNLTAMDQARFFRLLMKEFPDEYPNMNAVAIRRKVSRAYVTMLMSALDLLEAQKPNLSEQEFENASHLNEGQLRAIRQIDDEGKRTVALKAVVNKNLSMRDGEKLASVINANPEMSSEEIGEKAEALKIQRKAFNDVAQKSPDQRAEAILAQGDVEAKKTEKTRQRLIDSATGYPESLMNALFGHYSSVGKKIPPSSAKALAFDVVDLLVQKSVKDKTIDDVIEEARRWQ